ncbi:hypothetical protein FHG87_018547 [Trinorchestia longiramus]|nr:hypothetical protein FHG87_018547 [Trinorchestia longiramus]
MSCWQGTGTYRVAARGELEHVHFLARVIEVLPREERLPRLNFVFMTTGDGLLSLRLFPLPRRKILVEVSNSTVFYVHHLRDARKRHAAKSNAVTLQSFLPSSAVVKSLNAVPARSLLWKTKLISKKVGASSSPHPDHYRFIPTVSGGVGPDGFHAPNTHLLAWRGGCFCAAVKRNKVQTVPCIPGRVTQGTEVSGLGSCTHRLAHIVTMLISTSFGIDLRGTHTSWMNPAALGLGLHRTAAAVVQSVFFIPGIGEQLSWSESQFELSRVGWVANAIGTAHVILVKYSVLFSFTTQIECYFIVQGFQLVLFVAMPTIAAKIVSTPRH